MPALTNPDLASEVPWIPADGNLWSVVGPLIFGTILAAIVSLVIAVPIAVGIALFISHYAPRRMASVLGYVVDLLAAIPSVVFGLWGVLVLAPKVQPVWQFFVDYLGWIPLFAGDANGNASNPPRVLMTTAHRARGDDPADHHRRQPRGLPADAAPARGGRAGPRRDPLGAHPHGGPAVRALGRHVRRDARPRPRARRDHGRPDDPVARAALLVQAAGREPAADDRREHRGAVQRRQRHRPLDARSRPAWRCSSSRCWSTWPPARSSRAARNSRERTDVATDTLTPEAAVLRRAADAGRPAPPAQGPHDEGAHLGRLRRRDDPAGLAHLERALQRARPLRPVLPDALDAQRLRRHGRRRRLPRAARHAPHHGPGRPDLGADRHPHGGLPRGVRLGHARPRRDLLRRRHDGHPVDRRRSVRVRALLPGGRAATHAAGSSAPSRCRC